MSIDLFEPLRDSVMELITADNLKIGDWKGEPAVFTRRPLPDDAPDLCVLINPPAGVTDFDALNSQRPIVVHDIGVYGRKAAPGSTDDQTREVEKFGFALRSHFHRNRFSVRPDGIHVIDVQARGPYPAPTDDEAEVGRMVTLTIRLRRE